MSKYLDVGTVRATAGNSLRQCTVTAPNVETAVEKLQERFNCDHEALRSVYDEWHYTRGSGALRGSRVWHEHTENPARTRRTDSEKAILYLKVGGDPTFI